MDKSARLLALALLVCTAACSGAKEPAARGAKRRALNVRTATVTARDVVYGVQALGSLEPAELVQVTAEVNGAARDVRFQAGDRVTPGTVLARIDPERYRLEAARAEAAWKRAIADAERALSEMRRREALAKDNLVSGEELGRARLENDRLSADVAAAKAALDIAQQNVRRSEVRPSRAGVIDTRTVDTGQFVQVGNALATLVDDSRLRLRFKVSESESLKAAPGQVVGFTVAALGNQRFEAEVYHVGRLADSGTRQVEVLAWVKNPGPLKPGFFAEVALSTERHEGAVVVPESAVQASERGFVVYAVGGGKAHQKQVRLGLRTSDGAVEIVSGLSAGETVVIEGSDRLDDGIDVAPVGEAQAGGGTPPDAPGTGGAAAR